MTRDGQEWKPLVRIWTHPVSAHTLGGVRSEYTHGAVGSHFFLHTGGVIVSWSWGPRSYPVGIENQTCNRQVTSLTLEPVCPL